MIRWSFLKKKKNQGKKIKFESQMFFRKIAVFWNAGQMVPSLLRLSSLSFAITTSTTAQKTNQIEEENSLFASLFIYFSGMSWMLSLWIVFSFHVGRLCFSYNHNNNNWTELFIQTRIYAVCTAHTKIFSYNGLVTTLIHTHNRLNLQWAKILLLIWIYTLHYK